MSSAARNLSMSDARSRPASWPAQDLALDLDIVDPETGEITRTVPGRKTELILHLSAADQTVGRSGNTRTPISPEQVKTWINTPGSTVIIRPVLDLPATSRSTPTRSPTGSDAKSRSVTTTACSRTAPNPPNAATWTTSSRTATEGRRVRAIWPRIVVAITGSRPLAR